MDKIKISCTSGITMKLSDMETFPVKFKLESQLEIERVVNSIIEDGFLFPIAIGKVGDKNYIVDGEVRYFALQELEYRGYEIPEIPVFFVRSSEKTIIRNLLMGTSTNHSVTKTSLNKLTKEDSLLKSLSFNEGTLIDFYTVADLDRIFEKYKREKPKALNGSENYAGLLLDGEI